MEDWELSNSGQRRVFPHFTDNLEKKKKKERKKAENNPGIVSWKAIYMYKQVLDETKAIKRNKYRDGFNFHEPRHSISATIILLLGTRSRRRRTCRTS